MNSMIKLKQSNKRQKKCFKFRNIQNQIDSSEKEEEK